MSIDFGPGVSRTLDAALRQFGLVVWQRGKPPLHSEQNFMQQVQDDKLQTLVRSLMPSGFLMDPTRSTEDFVFNPLWANHFHLGEPRAPHGAHDGLEEVPVIWANVNGWVIPVAGTDIQAAPIDPLYNVVRLSPPPSSDARIDMVYLEVWQAVVAANPSAQNKPTASTVWKYGNTKYGGANLADDLEDPTIGVETTRRVQTQYAIRVFGSGVGGAASVNLSAHPDGIDDPNILAQGAATAPVAAMTFGNMRETLGDASLWRAGDGDPSNGLGTVDGYVYAIPICAVFRRNSAAYVAVTSSGDGNQNGAKLRLRTSTTPADAAVLLQASLTNALNATDGVSLQTIISVTGLNGSGIESIDTTAKNYFWIDDEIIEVSAMNVPGGTLTISAGGRGAWGSAVCGHAAGTPLQFFNSRPDGQFADEIRSVNLLDLRRAINPGDWDYDRILRTNISALAQNRLRSTWKRSNPGDTSGPVVHEVDDLWAGGVAHFNQTDPVDGPDGIRTVWSDAVTPQFDVTVMCDNTATRDANGNVGFTNGAFDATVNWDVGADFNPIGFLNTGAAGQPGWTNGSSIHLFLGGSDGSSGARGTFRDGTTKAVRFITPKEYWKTSYPVINLNNGDQNPVKVRFIGEKLCQSYPPVPAMSLADQMKFPGALYPWQADNFETPFIVLGGLLNATFDVSGVNVSNLKTEVGPQYEIDLTTAGFTFNQSFVETVLSPLGRSLRQLLTANDTDITGNSSEVYIVTFGDQSGVNNNGAFKVVGMGTTGVTEKRGSNTHCIVVEPLSADFSGWSATGSGNLIRIQFRSPYHHVEDISNYGAKQADLVLAFTDIAGEDGLGTPWDTSVLGNKSLPRDAGNANKYYADSKAVIDLSLLYSPGRSAMARVPDEVNLFAGRSAIGSIGSYLRRSKTAIDPDFVGVQTDVDEVHWDPIHVQTWNRLPGLGWSAPALPDAGGNVVGFTEIDREHELFFDRGSKSIIFRPFRSRLMTLKALTYSDVADGELAVDECLFGAYAYPDGPGTAKDGLQILTGNAGAQDTTGKKMGFPVPPEWMPRFGRQDIPVYQLTPGTAPDPDGFLPGINHLFQDVTDTTDPVFNIIGGRANLTAGNAAYPLLFHTNSPAAGKTYAQVDTVFGPGMVGAYMARRTGDISNATIEGAAIISDLAAVNSSDFGRGLTGIQMPPYTGIARLMGVYEYNDYIAKGGTTFKSNRWEMDVDPATNLVREDADQQTLFILEDGGQDLIEGSGGHTYIIPDNVLDLRRIPGFAEGQDFGDFHYVVEATVFFFAHDWITKNNLVCVRRFNGQGIGAGLVAENLDGANPELQGLPMCIPCPAGMNDRFYVAYNRTVYQGDVFGTREGGTHQSSDYGARYGRLSPAQEYLLRTAIAQYDSAGNFVPQTPNQRTFEVLASMDFYTTLGTGKMGGQVYPSTSLDIGFIENTGEASTRMPASSSDNPWGTNVRAFTEGQLRNTSRASIQLALMNHADLNTGGGVLVVVITTQDGTDVPLACGSEWADGADLLEAAENLAAAINNHTGLVNTVTANPLSNRVEITAVPSGVEGNGIRAFIYHTDQSVSVVNTTPPIAFFIGEHNRTQTRMPTASYLIGGSDLPVNAGSGVTQVNLTGMTERLPLGVLLQDSDFIGENPLNDNSSSMRTSPVGIRPVHNTLPLTVGGEEYGRFLGAPGSLIVMADGQIAPYSWEAWTGSGSGLGATKKFRLYRGGGSAYFLDEETPGGPLDWVADSIPGALKPVLKGGVLACRALLVRNYYEEALVTEGYPKMSDGDEIQMIVLTYGHFGTPETTDDGVTLDGIISPAGYGEGYAAADRYRLLGKPMMRALSSRETPDLNQVQLAVYPETTR